jgi:hypothetical protein
MDARSPCAAVTRLIVEENKTERQNTTLMARHTLLASFAPYFITINPYQDVLQMNTHRGAIEIIWNFLSPIVQV